MPLVRGVFHHLEQVVVCRSRIMPRKPFHIRDIVRLAPADKVDGAADAQVLKRIAKFRVRFFYKRLLVFFVEHQKFLGKLEHMNIFSQKPHAKAVECRNVARIVALQHGADSFFHLEGGLVRKSRTQDVRRRNSELLGQVQVTVRERPGLAGTRPRNHADIAFGHLYSEPLFVIEPVRDCRNRSICQVKITHHNLYIAVYPKIIKSIM